MEANRDMMKRVPVREQDPKERATNFKEVCLGYDMDEAMERQRIYKTQEGRAMLRLKEGDTHHGGCGQCGGDK